ncbi:MAG: DUF655 domain-containing protein [Candidatus Aenigmatarchaeota archaeon]|nr:DUF655 domain-containing protein [Candidatus Aenigmarchaeota archaeon]
MPLRDETAVVLDFLPKGHATGKPEPLAQLLGDRYFTLLEAVAREGVTIKHGDKVYIGEGERKEIDHIKRRITINELTSFARNELPFIVEKIVRDNEARFVDFYNKSQPISTRVHQLELLPGIGKKHMFDILAERKKAPFKSFDDVKNRIRLLSDPAGLIAKRIIKELENENERFRLFVLGPQQRRF